MPKALVIAVVDQPEALAAEPASPTLVPKHIGHLLKVSTEIECPSCHEHGMSRIEREVVTCVQKSVALLNCLLCCKPLRWSGRHDINHYCANCGCFVGRYMTLSWYKRKLFKMQRYEAENESRWQRFMTIEKEQLDMSRRKAMPKANAAMPDPPDL